MHFKVSSQVTQTHNKLAVFETSNKMVVGDFITGNKLGAGNVDTTQFFDVFLFLWFVTNADNIFVADLNDTGKNTRLDLIIK